MEIGKAYRMWWCWSLGTRGWWGARWTAVLDSWVFSGTANPVRDVMVAGDWVVREERPTSARRWWRGRSRRRGGRAWVGIDGAVAGTSARHTSCGTAR